MCQSRKLKVCNAAVLCHCFVVKSYRKMVKSLRNTIFCGNFAEKSTKSYN